VLLYGANHSRTVALRRERRSRFDSDTPLQYKLPVMGFWGQKQG